VSVCGANGSGDAGFPIAAPTARVGARRRAGDLGKDRGPVADWWVRRDAERVEQ
jgi:hypothetical protein